MIFIICPGASKVIYRKWLWFYKIVFANNCRKRQIRLISFVSWLCLARSKRTYRFKGSKVNGFKSQYSDCRFLVNCNVLYNCVLPFLKFFSWVPIFYTYEAHSKSTANFEFLRATYIRILIFLWSYVGTHISHLYRQARPFWRFTLSLTAALLARVFNCLQFLFIQKK